MSDPNQPNYNPPGYFPGDLTTPTPADFPQGPLFTLPDEVLAIYRWSVESLIAQWGKVCRLVYPARWTPCPNCVWDAVGNKSSNRWKTGGPMPFPNGQTCPLCNGAGRRAEEVSEEVKLLCAWDPRNFFYPAPTVDLRSPYAVIQTKGHITDLPKFLRADHLVFQLPLSGYGPQNYKLLDAPADRANILQNQYCLATWERKG
jgi:hypothetical protein